MLEFVYKCKCSARKNALVSINVDITIYLIINGRLTIMRLCMWLINNTSVV